MEAAARTLVLVAVAVEVEGKTREAVRVVTGRREVLGPQRSPGTFGARRQPQIWSGKKWGVTFKT